MIQYLLRETLIKNDGNVSYAKIKIGGEEKMRKRRLKNYRWHISLITLVLFCLSLLPTNLTIVGADELQKVKIRFN